jgi:hypothetical protein
MVVILMACASIVEELLCKMIKEFGFTLMKTREQKMNKYRVSYYSDGVKHSFTVTANSKDEALQKAWCLVDADDVYVSEVE